MTSVVLTSGREQLCLRELKCCIQENRALDNFAEFFDDRFLLHFVRGKKYDSKRAYATLENYIYVRRVKYKQMFRSLKPSLSTALDIKSVRILRNRDHVNRLIVLTRINFWDPRVVSAHEYTNMVVLAVEEMWNYKDAEDNGIVLIFDLAGYNMQHALALTIPQFIKYVSLLWNNYPLRPKAIHIVNEIYMCNVFLKTVKPLLHKKIAGRLNFHSSDMDSLHEHLSPAILPEFLGGNLSQDEAFDLTFEQRIRDKEDYYQRFASMLK